MHDMGSLGHTLQIDLPRDWALGEPRPVPGCVEGGGQLMRCGQCSIYFNLSLSFLLLGAFGWHFVNNNNIIIITAHCCLVDSRYASAA